MKRSTKIIIGSVVGLGLAGAVAAKQFSAWNFGPEHRADWVSERVSKHLELNDTQQAELDKLKTTALAAMSSMHSQRPEFSEIEVLFNTEFDQTKALQLFTQRSQMVTDKAPEMIAAFANFYNTLDDDQRTEVSAMVKQRMTGHDSGRGRHGWGHHGGFSAE